ncbi:MAG: phosphate signaling complex protein PhoU [Flavobacteriales bacterium]|nr:phosphate signaling complex protein PhoU [Flavobacteriales bacterium]PJC62705.1 MAG: phosphate transport system regulatory protein PhoU [Flavobacteriales bacterium CG_4_9_14_0_2_um_filter_32_27]
MTHLDSELKQIKQQVIEMMTLVRNQLAKGKNAVLTFDKDLVHEINANEKRVNAMELSIDRAIENTLALYTPVAVDLRFVMASFKISADLERIGDNAVGIAKYINHVNEQLTAAELDKIKFVEMYENALLMLENVFEAFEKEDTKLAREVFVKDKVLNKINLNAASITIQFIQQSPDKINNYLYLLSIIRKLERVGDLAKNIAEELIFYIEAKVLKHHKKK